MNIFKYFTPKSETLFLNHNSTIRQTIEKFERHKFSVVPMVDEDGMYVSSLSEGDILRYIKNETSFDLRMAERVMIKNIEVYRPYSPCRIDVSTEEVISLAMEQNFVPIIDDRGLYMGIIKRKTILELMYEKKL